MGQNSCCNSETPPTDKIFISRMPRDQKKNCKPKSSHKFSISLSIAEERFRIFRRALRFASVG